MNNIKKLLRYKTVFIAIILYVFLFVFRRDIFVTSINSFITFIIELFKVLPPVMIITALISVWVPSEIITKTLGRDSGLKGIFISFITGILSSGPIYAGFPATLILFKKGASIRSVVIILSSWAVIKLPMFFVESSFLGSRFATLRYIVTIPVIISMGFLMQMLVKRFEIKSTISEVSLPMLNCSACGYGSCKDFKKALERGEVKIESCKIITKSNR